MIIFPFAGCLGSKSDRIKAAFSEYKGPYLVYISKKRFTLEVFNRDLRKIIQYKIGYGKNQDRKPKHYEGDNRTPEGTYCITRILSIDAEKNSNAYRTLKKMNNVYFTAASGHYKFRKPDTDLGKNVYGSRYFEIDYPNENDKKNYELLLKQGKIPVKKGKFSSIGGGIAIHGNNDPDSIGYLASSGCVRMYNQDIIEMEQYIRIGMPVIISAE